MPTDRRAHGLRLRRGVRHPRSIAIFGWGLALGLSLLPLRFGEATVYNAGLVLIFIVATLGLHLLVNWAGQLSLAHAGMVGLPALVVAALSESHHISPFYLLPVGALIGAATGIGVSFPAMKAKGVQIALVTLTAGIAIDRFFLQQDWLVGATKTRTAAIATIGPFEFRTAKDQYLVLLAIVAVTLVFFWVLMHSKLYRGWLWTAADPDAASAFGVPIGAYKVGAYAAAGAFAGLAGSMTVAWVRHISAGAFPTSLSFTYLLAAVLAGAGFAGGVVVAGIAITGGPVFFLSASTGVNRILSYVGPVVLILNITIYKSGFNGAGRALLHRVEATRARRPHPVGEPRDRGDRSASTDIIGSNGDGSEIGTPATKALLEGDVTASGIDGVRP